MVHRADLHQTLWDAAKKVGAEMYLNSKVVQYDFEEGKVTLQDGTKYSGDLIIVADGIKSLARQQMFSTNDVTHDIGYTTYRTTIEMKQLEEDYDLRDCNILRSWNYYSSTGKFIIFYPVCGGEILNIVFFVIWLFL